MQNSAINSQQYWDGRFDTDWNDFGGDKQSRFFSNVAIAMFPSWLKQRILTQSLSVADWGCASGEGTARLAEWLPNIQVTGIDFSESAISQAKNKHHGCQFVCANLLESNNAIEPFDLIFSSNTLEHFHTPWDTFKTLSQYARRYIVLLLPFEEYNRIDEHFYTFESANIPVALNSWVLVHSDVVDTGHLQPSYWSGQQVLLVFAHNKELTEAQLLLDQVRCLNSILQTTRTYKKIISENNKQHEAEKDGLTLYLNQLNETILAQKREIEGYGLQKNLLEQEIKQHKEFSEQAHQNHMSQKTSLEQSLVHSQLQIAELEEKTRALLNSNSWRITRPIRYARRKMGGVARVTKSRIRATAKLIYTLLPLSHKNKQALKNAILGKRPVQTVTTALQPTISNQSIAYNFLLNNLENTESNVFVFAVIDWHFRMQRPQHLAKGLAQCGKRVFYFSNHFVNSAEPGYEVERLDEGIELYQIKLHVNGAPAIYFAGPTQNDISSINASMSKFLLDFGVVSSISIVQHAYWYPTANGLPNNFLMYDCMDHHEGFGNVPQEIIDLEHKLLATSNSVITTSSWLEDFAKTHNPNVVTIRNATEYGHFAKSPQEVFIDPKGRKIIGYFGAIAEWFDVELVGKIAHHFPDCLILLIGNDTINASKQLKAPNIEFVGEVPYHKLPYYLHAFDVCLLPFLVIPLTLATNPVKVYEYLSAGKSVVSVDLPELSQFEGLVRTAATHDEFARQIQLAMDEMPLSNDIVQARQHFAQQQTWRLRTEKLLSYINNCQSPKVSIVVVTYNNLELTKNCLHSIDKYSDYANKEIIVVDNQSTDGSDQFLKEWVLGASNRKLILNEDNKGFSAANNQGIALASGEYYVLLNNDTYVTPGWIRTMLNCFQSESSIGIVGPVTNNIGNEAKIDISYASMSEMLVQSMVFTRRHIGSTKHLKVLAFFCVMFSSKLVDEIGVLDEAFGQGFFEDDDYCRRAEQAGYRLVCAENVFIHHHLSASFNKLRQQDRRALFERNKQIYEAKWGTWTAHQHRVTLKTNDY